MKIKLPNEIDLLTSDGKKNPFEMNIPDMNRYAQEVGQRSVEVKNLDERSEAAIQKFKAVLNKSELMIREPEMLSDFRTNHEELKKTMKQYVSFLKDIPSNLPSWIRESDANSTDPNVENFPNVQSTSAAAKTFSEASISRSTNDRLIDNICLQPSPIPAKKIKMSFIAPQKPQPPQLPLQVSASIQNLRGTELIFLIQKEVSKTDLDKNQGQLLIPNNAVTEILKVLTVKEKGDLEIEGDKIKKEMMENTGKVSAKTLGVMVIDGEGKTFIMILAKRPSSGSLVLREN